MNKPDIEVILENILKYDDELRFICFAFWVIKLIVIILVIVSIIQCSVYLKQLLEETKKQKKSVEKMREEVSEIKFIIGSAYINNYEKSKEDNPNINNFDKMV